MMSIFGSGVVQGWTTSAAGSFSINISEGFGNINFFAARTEFPTTLDNLPPNSISYLYAKINERTRFAEDTEFILSPTQELVDPHFLLLSKITTNGNGIESIDDSVRQEIGFLEVIKSAIRLHRHRGGTLNPSKIDLVKEVKGQLPSFRIADFDAEKVTTGLFDLARIPLIDHQDLQNIGILTHGELDTFVKTLEGSNKELFGEISTANLLQMILSMKLIYDDPASAQYFSNRTVDQYMINEVAVIPGITPDNYIDFQNSTATINTSERFISGVAPSTGTSFFVHYDTNLAWKSAYLLDQVIVSDNHVVLAFNNDDERNIVSIENFESATTPNQILSGTDDGGQELFKKETVIVDDKAKITANSSSTNLIEGFYSGKFSVQESFRVQYRKEFTETKDWSTYESLVLSIKCMDEIHGSVKIFFYNADGTKSAEYVILEPNEITQNDIASENDFEMRVIDLSLISFNSAMKGFVIFSDDTETPFTFYIDYINIQRQVRLPEEGTVLLRYSSSEQITFASIDWSSTEPTGTEIKVRARSANGTAYLTRASYTRYLNSSDLINLRGTDLEIEITLLPDSDRIHGPTLESLRILVVSESELTGFTIDTDEEYERGNNQNTTVDNNHVSIKTPVYVDSYYFVNGNLSNQIHPTTNLSGNTFVEAELALFGQNAPIAPNQIFRIIETGESRTTQSKFFEPKSIIRTQNKTFVIADTFNDRVLEFDESGNLENGIGSINYEHTEKVFPISASIDSRTGILYIVWSKKLSFKAINVSKITIQTITQKIQLTQNFDRILGLSDDELENVNPEGQIVPIYLSEQNYGLVQDITSTAYLSINADALSTGIDFNSVFYKAIVTGLGIPLFIGKFAYIDGIFAPTFANKTSTNGFLIANATIGIANYQFPATITEKIDKTSNNTPIIETDENNHIIFSTDKMNFSPFIPGKVHRIDKHTLLIGGIKPNGTLGTIEENALNFRSIQGSADDKKLQKETLNKLFFGDQTNPLSGAVIVLDTGSDASTFEYFSAEGSLVSDVDIDQIDGEYIVAESSINKSGRVIKVDSIGTITFSFGEGTMSLINDVISQKDGSFIVST